MERAPFQKRQNPGTKRRDELPVSQLSHIYWSAPASHARIQHQTRSTYKLQIRHRTVSLWKHPHHAKTLPNTTGYFPGRPVVIFSFRKRFCRRSLVSEIFRRSMQRGCRR
jgi:hypothetical protein